VAAKRPPRPATGPRRTPPSSPSTATSASRSRAPRGPSGPPPRTGPPPPPASRLRQRLLAVLLTVMLFGLIVFGAGAGFATFGERWVGYVVGGLFCVVMVVGAVVSSRRSR
jgi:hypothetical protein